MEKQILNLFKDKKILVTGGTGSIGNQIALKLLDCNPKVVRILSNDENETFKLSQKIERQDNVRFLIGDIRDKERLVLAMEDIDIVFHAAALKHVTLCEYNPFEAIKTNVIGNQNIIESALINNVNKVINISTDKAVNPINTMGATKLLAEKLMIDANEGKGIKQTIFSCVRFGNVLNSRGSVIPIIKQQIKNKKTLTITDPDMTRFIMSIQSTIDLVFKATLLSKGGEIFILKMPVIKLGDLVDVLIETFSKKYGNNNKDIKKKIIGPRAGEKIFEELMTESEAEMAYETDDMLIIPPQIELPNIKYDVSEYKNAWKSKMYRYISREIKPLSKTEIKKILFS